MPLRLTPLPTPRYQRLCALYKQVRGCWQFTRHVPDDEPTMIILFNPKILRFAGFFVGRHAAPIRHHMRAKHSALVLGTEFTGNLHIQLGHGRVNHTIPTNLRSRQRSRATQHRPVRSLSTTKFSAHLERGIVGRNLWPARTSATPEQSVRATMQSRHPTRQFNYNGELASYVGGKERCEHRGPQIRVKTERWSTTRGLPSCNASFPDKHLTSVHQTVVLPTWKDPNQLCRMSSHFLFLGLVSRNQADLFH